MTGEIVIKIVFPLEVRTAERELRHTSVRGAALILEKIPGHRPRHLVIQQATGMALAVNGPEVAVALVFGLADAVAGATLALGVTDLALLDLMRLMSLVAGFAQEAAIGPAVDASFAASRNAAPA